MIIKSMSRKSRSFAQLFDYMNREDGIEGFIPWNLQSVPNRERVLEQFYDNADLLRSHTKGNVLYHEIISLKFRSDVSLQRQMHALNDVTRQYLSARAPHLLGFGRAHLEQGHLHVHLMLSSNELRQARRHRLTKIQFREIQTQCERYLQQAYPELKQPILYDRSQALSKTPSPTSAPSHEEVKEALEALLEESDSKNLNPALQKAGFKLYERGRSLGVVYRGKRFRLTTLGLDEALFRPKPPSPEFTSGELLEEEIRLQELESYFEESEVENLESPDL